MKLLLAVLALVAAGPANAADPDFQGRNGKYTIAFSEIARNRDSSWKGAEVTVRGPNGYVQYFTATFQGTDHGTIEVEGDPCRLHIDTVTDAQGNDAGWRVGFESYDEDEMGCDVLPGELAGVFTAF